MTAPISRRRRLLAGVLLVSLAAPLPVLDGAAPATAAGTSCRVATNIEAIVDDSGSMADSDPDVLRGQALNMLNAQPTLKGDTLGAVEFGDVVDTLFAPAPVPSGLIAGAVGSLEADNGDTDYNIAFDQAKSDNPTAGARIFITDGGHNVGEYLDGHLGGPPTYVIGIGIEAADGTDEDADRLQQIASDTGGSYYADVNITNLQAVVNDIAGKIACATITRTYTDTFTAAAQQKSKRFKVRKSSRSLNFTLTWASPSDAFSITKIRQTAHGHHHKPHIRITRGPTYVVVHVTKLVPGRLTFVLRSDRIGSGVTTGVTLTTQAQQVKPPKHKSHHAKKHHQKKHKAKHHKKHKARHKKHHKH